jgi:hypothetical protein
MHLNPIWAIKKLLIQSIILITSLTACQTSQTGTPIPTAEVFDLYYSPALGYLQGKISSCISTLGTVAPYIHEQPSASTSLLDRNVILTLGEVEWDVDDYFVTQIGTENIVFIVNVANPLENIEKDELKEIFSGRQTIWHSEFNNENQIKCGYTPMNRIYPSGSRGFTS